MKKSKLLKRNKVQAMKYVATFYIWIVSSIYLFWFINYFTYKFKKHGPEKMFYKASKALRRLFKLMFVKVIVIEEEPIDRTKPYIFMPNHVSFIDAFLFGAYLPVCGNSIEADRNFKWPLYGKMITAYEQIPINRNNIRSSIKTFEVAKERLKKGRSIIVFPEGHRTKSGYLQKFKKLPFVFAYNADADIIPVGVSGMLKLNPRNSIWMRPTTIILRYGKVIKKEEIKDMKVEDLMNLVRKQIIDLVDDYTEDDIIAYEKTLETIDAK